MTRLMEYVEQAMPADAASIMRKTRAEVARGPLALTLALAILMLSGAVLLVFGGSISAGSGATPSAWATSPSIWNIAQWPRAVLFVVFGVALFYYTAPAVDHRKRYGVTPGSLVVTVGWIALSLATRSRA
jgi:membrane protein